MTASKRSADENTPSPPSKRRRSCSPDSFIATTDRFRDSLNICLLDAKLDAETIEELISLIDNFNELPPEGSREPKLLFCPTVVDADVVVTGIHMRNRLERHVNWSTAKQKTIVTPQWLRDSVKSKQLLPCDNYAAIGELHEETARNCPVNNDCSNPQANAEGHSRTRDGSEIRHNHYYACMRHSPLVCPNQELVEKLAVLRQHRELEGQDMHALSYSRAIAILKAFPYIITTKNIEEVSELPHIGEKIFSKINEYIRHGDISECKTILNETRYQSLITFTTIHGIGPSTAQNLYSSGLRTMQDLEKHYGVTPETCDDASGSLNPQNLSDNSKTSLPQLSIKVWIALRDEFSMRIPRTEVEAVRDVVMKELAHIRRGCISTIAGGYRRGKVESNDIDIVITHEDFKPKENEVKGLCAELMKRLFDKGIVTHVMHLTNFRERDTLGTSRPGSLEKAMTVFILPEEHRTTSSTDGETKETTKTKRVHRRVDLIFASYEVYWTAVVGWTGSAMFQRDLRLWAKQEKGMKFDSSGISRRHNSKYYFPRSEEEVFEHLGLEFIDPTLRNADP